MTEPIDHRRGWNRHEQETYAVILNNLTARHLPNPPYGDNPPTHWAPVHRPPLRVRVRIEWDTGEEWHEAIASAWDPRDGAVYIYLEDARTRVKGLWMHTSDVRPIGLVE